MIETVSVKVRFFAIDMKPEFGRACLLKYIESGRISFAFGKFENFWRNLKGEIIDTPDKWAYLPNGWWDLEQYNR